MLKKIKKAIKLLLSSISPKITANIVFFNVFKRLPNTNKKNFNDELYYLKFNTYFHNDLVTKCSDKLRVKEYVSDKGFSNLLPKLYFNCKSPKDINKVWDKLPKKMVIKCNHGCGYNIIIDNKDNFDKEKVIKQLNKWIKEDYWKIYGEPQYMDIEKAILVDSYLGNDILAFKFYCFYGIPKYFYISRNGINNKKDLYVDFYDINLNYLDISFKGHTQYGKEKIDVKTFEEMKKISTILANDFPFVRVDLFLVNNKIYFSELTFIPTGGNMLIKPTSYLDKWGEILTIN